MENKKQFPTILKKRSDFLTIYKLGRREYPNNWLILNYKKNSFSFARYGWTVPKFVGNAVLRNRFKRWCREIVRKNHQKNDQVGLDINIVFKRTKKEFYKNLTYDELEKQINKATFKLFK